MKPDLPLLFFAMVQVMLLITHRHPHVVQVSPYLVNKFDSSFMKLEELLVNVSLTSTPPLNILQPRHKSTPFDLLKAPLLNLKPLSDDGPDHEGIPSSSPKKRKRRRRKKNMLMHSAADIDMGNMLPDLE